MINRILLVVLFTCACITSQAQVNLVKNPSLEDHWRCPVLSDEIAFANFWSCIDTMYTFPAVGDTFGDPGCTPEYINSCSTNIGTSEPENSFFYHYPRTGNGMAQVMMYYDESIASDSLNDRDYLMGRLYNTLAAGQSYCVTFYVVSEAGSAFGINHIGAYLDNGSIDTSSHCGWIHPEDVPQVYTSAIINDTLNWTKIQGSFIANGTERYITISNFFDSAHTSKIRLTTDHWAYYLVDDVSVIASNATADAGPDITINAGCSTYIGLDSNGDGMPCYWYVLGGTAPIDSGGSIIVRPTDTTTYVVAMDLCGTVTYDTVTVNVLPCAGLPAVSFTDTGSHTIGFTYTGTTSCTDSIRWNFGDGSTSTLTDPVHTYSTAGTYSVCATVYTYCGSNSACSTVSVVTEASPPSTSLRAGLEPMVYPNPAGDVLHIDNAAGSEVRVFDIMGIEVLQFGGAHCDKCLMKGKEVIDISYLPEGVYIVQIVRGNGERKCVRVVHTSQ